MNTTDNTHSRAPTHLSSSLRFAATLFVALGLTLGLSVTVPQTALAQNTYTVTSTGDAGDDNPGDGNCDDGNGNCTLPAAIEEADAAPNNEDTIAFGDIAPGGGGPAQIAPGSALFVDETVTIDGTTEDNYTGDAPTVLIDGSSLPNNIDDGLFLNSGADDSTIRALAIVDAPDMGIDVGNSVTIQDCYVGVSTDGTTANGNGNHGINLFGDENQVSESVIGGNGSDGIRAGGSDNIISSNQIGVGSDGTTNVGNGAAGVRATGSGNSIGLCILGNCTGNTISGNGESGIQIEAENQTVLANNIGTDESGTSAIPNDNGIAVESSGNTIGSTGDAGNLISGNTFNGIRLGVGGGNPANNNTVENNDIGVADGGSSALPNGNGCVEGGVRVDNGSDNTITSNVISGNNATGIYVRGSSSLSNTITDNLIGTNGSSDALGNSCDGIQIDTDAGIFNSENEIHNGNVIAFNDEHGVDINGSFGKVTNNFIGTNANGDDLGNNLDGVNVSAGQVLIGRSSNLGEDGNIIGHNGNDGIDLRGASSASVFANYIGTNANDADLGNGDIGIEVREDNNNAATDNEVGYASSDTFSDPLPSDGGDGNVVAYNGSKGIAVDGTPSTANPIRGNSVYQNGGANDNDIGIDLGNSGQTNNDDANDDADDGPNNLQNFPIIEDVTYNQSNDNVSITYRVQTSTGNATYPLKVDFYAADSESSGEGKTYLDTQEYQSGDARSGVTNVIDLSNFSDVDSDDYFVATATDDDGNTSEFFGPPGQQLPVELASFEAAQSSESAVELRWTTASETNNAGFRVQHRASGEESWTRLGYVASKASGGTTTEAKTYRFDAEGLAVGTHEFRLKQMDLDGTAHLHDPVDVELQMQQALRLKAPAPNPVQGQAQLSFAVRDQTETTITMYNPLGQKVAVVYRGTPPAGEQQTAQVTTDDLASGVYFLRLQAGGTTKTQKMTVVR